MIHSIWGSGSGPLICLAPKTRVVLWLSGLACSLLSRPNTIQGFLLLLATVALLGLGARIPRTILLRTALLGSAMLLPLFLLAPWIQPSVATPDGPSDLLWERLGVPCSILIKGLAIMVISASAFSTLSLLEFQEALVATGLPTWFAILCQQVIYQSATLVVETRRMALAFALRAGTAGRLIRLKLARSLPMAWLPRVLARAERVAVAMELRGFGKVNPRVHARSLASRDWAVLAACSALMAAHLFLRFGG